MKHLKHLFTALLLLCATAATAYDFYVGGIHYNITSSTDKTVAVTYGYADYSNANYCRGNVVIPESVTYNGITYRVTSIGSSAFIHCSYTTSVTIPNSVTSIGEKAFFDCALTSITIPSSVTSIGSFAFSYPYGSANPSIISVNISNIETWLNIDFADQTSNPLCRGGNLYLNGELVTDIVIPNDITSIKTCTFYNCRSLTNVVIPSNVTSIGSSAFSGCTGLTSITIPSSVTSIGNDAFAYCTRLTSVVIPNSVTSIGSSAFSSCIGLTSITIPNSVTSIGNFAFDGCTSLKDLCIEDGESTLSLGCNEYKAGGGGHGLFYDCPLEILYLGRNLSYYTDSSYGYSPFYGISTLTFVTIADNVTTIGKIDLAGTVWYDNMSDGIVYCGKVLVGYKGVMPKNTSVYVKEGTIKIASSAFSGRTGLTSITIPNSVTSIGNFAFNGCTSLKDLRIEDGESTLSLGYETYKSSSNGEGLFYDCPLETIYLGRRLSYSTGSSYGYSPFYGISTLASVTLGSKFTTIPQYMFGKCGTIESLTIPASVLDIDSEAFTGTTLIKTIFLGNTRPTGVRYARGEVNYVSSAANYGFGTEYTNLSSMFEVGGVKYVLVSAKDRTCDVIDCNYNNPVEDVVIDSLVTYRNVKLKVRNVNDYALYDNDNIKSTIIKNNGYIGSYAFYDCDSVVNATLGNSVGAINNYAFASCGVLEKIVIPDNVPSVGSYCFENCTSLEKAIIGAGVKQLNTKTFSGCKAMTEVKIGENVETIDTYVFENCSSLPQINIPQATRTINNYVFKGCQNLSTVVIEDKVFSLSLGSNGSSPLFADCKLDSVYIGGKLQYNKTSSYGYSPFYGNKYLHSVTYNDMEEAIYDKEFMNCSNLQNIVFGKGITSIGVSAFKNCTSLPGITIPDEVQTMGNSCFAGCTALKDAKVGTGVKTLEWYSFGGCTALTDMQIGVNVDSIGKSVFYGCSALPEIKIPQATRAINDSVFYKCTSLADVIIEDRTTTLRLGSNGSSSSSSATTSTNPLFHSCPLDSVYIGGKISYKTDAKYGFSPFFRNTSLRTVVVSDTETLVYDNEFYGCTGLTDVVIGDGVTAIGNWAFSGCTGLVNFSFGSSVETIGAEAFSDCTSMVKIVSSCNVPPVCGDQALADINVWDCTLYVPNDYIDAYYSAEQWWDFFFIDGAEYTITFMIGDEKYSEATIKYGAEITLPVPTKEGYTFLGWVDVPAVMPADNIVVYGSFKANDYTITYIVDGEVYETVSVAYDSEITPIAAPEKDGYTFNRWENLPVTMPAGDIEVTAVYDEIPTEVTITIGKYGSATYSSAYALDFTNVAGLNAYAATGYNTNTGVITMTRVMTSSEGTGLFLKGEPGTYVVPIIESSDDNSLNMLAGVMEPTIVNSVSDDGLYANYRYMVKSGTSVPLFYRYTDGSSVGAGKAYLQIPLEWLPLSPMKSISFRFDDGETTDIDEVTEKDADTTVYYDLNGHIVTNPVKGIYIVNGKKVYVE